MSLPDEETMICDADSAPGSTTLRPGARGQGTLRPGLRSASLLVTALWFWASCSGCGARTPGVAEGTAASLAATDVQCPELDRFVGFWQCDGGFFAVDQCTVRFRNTVHHAMPMSECVGWSPQADVLYSRVSSSEGRVRWFLCPGVYDAHLEGEVLRLTGGGRRDLTCEAVPPDSLDSWQRGVMSEGDLVAPGNGLPAGF